MRDYSYFDRHYAELLTDIYAQPADDIHTNNIRLLIYGWLSRLGLNSVLDAGCGEGMAEDYFKEIYPDIQYVGVALGADVVNARKAGRNVVGADFNFLDDNEYDLVLARHALEHSPFPLITLMEWHRISRKWLCVVLPNPEFYTYVGKNHYSVLSPRQAVWLHRRAGWKLKKFYMNTEEIWMLCEKKPRIGCEGWAKEPLSQAVYEFERDALNTKNKIVNVKGLK